MGTNSKSKNVFAIIELIVVVGVVLGILIITVFSYLSSQQKERDSRRKADLKMLSQALDQYFDTCGYKFPSKIPESGAFSCPAPRAKTYLNEMPRDPVTNAPYSYTSEKSNTIYTLCTNNMETAQNTKYCISNK